MAAALLPSYRFHGHHERFWACAWSAACCCMARMAFIN